MIKSRTSSAMPTRRHILKAGVAASLLSGAAPRMSWAQTDADVIVIGGGLSGLAAALTLEEFDLKVRLVEADTRLGGRCYTLSTDEGDFDCGATTIGPLYGRLRDFAERANVELKAPPGRDRFSYLINGGFVHPDAWEGSSHNQTVGFERSILPERLEFPIVQKFNKIGDITDWATPETLNYDISLDAFLAQKGISKEARRLMAITSNVLSMEDTSALFQMREFGRLALPQTGSAEREVYAAGKGGDYHYVKGGTSQLIRGMAGLLKSEPMMNAPVTAIDLEADGASVRLANGQQLRAKAVICTIPFSALRDVAISPAPQGIKQTAIAASAYTLTTHVMLLPTKPYWELDGHPAGFLSDDVVERVMANYDDDGQVAWLDVWLNGQQAAYVDRLPEAERAAFVIQRLGELRPAMKGAVRYAGQYSWGLNPYIKGNKFIMRPGEVRTLFPSLAVPHAKRLLFAGEHTRDFEAGMEAATASGVREALRYLEQFA